MTRFVRNPRLDRAVLSLALCLATAGAAAGAKRLMPPALVMTEAQNVVALVEVEPGADRGRLRLRRIEVLRGEMPSEVVVRAAPIESALHSDRTYLVSYTIMRRNPLDRETLEIDPDGPRIVSLPLVGQALLPASSELRLLIERSEGGEQGAEYLEALFTELRGGGLVGQRFSIAELYLRPELDRFIESSHLEQLQTVAGSSKVDAEPRSLVFQIAARLPSEQRAPWLGDVARAVVSDAATDLDLTSTEPLLIQTALGILGTEGAAGDATIVAPHCSSNSPGVAKAALDVLASFDPELAAAVVEEALEAPDLHYATRQAMERFLDAHPRDDGSE